MKLRFFSLLLLSANAVSAQWVEDFADGNFSQQPVWSGDTSSFNVSPAGQLQLNATDAGTAVLFTPISMTDLNGMEWRFRIRLDFSPSSTNFARVYLATDQPSINGNGYFLQFGEALSNDAVELLRQDGATVVPICRATDGTIASAFEIGIKVVRDRDAIWSLSIDPTGGTRYQLEAVGAEGRYGSSSWLGLRCTHTVSNSSRFYFDDFYVGPIIQDTIPEPEAGLHDVVFNEVYFEPIAESDLPDDEFIEMYNRATMPFRIDGWHLTDGTSIGVFPPGAVIEPKALILVCASSDTSVFNRYGKTIGIPGFPALNNDVGDRLILSDRSGQVIDALSFADRTYANPEKVGGGWTIERRDTSFVCEDEGNWSASIDVTGGTPGRINSVSSEYFDELGPVIDFAWMPDSAHIEIFFSEIVDTSNVQAVQAFYITDSSGNDIVFSGDWTKEDMITIWFDPPYSGGIYRICPRAVVTDCPGNTADESICISTALASKPDIGDIVFNEMLSDPFEGASDFVEIANRSDRIIDLFDLFIAETDKSEAFPVSSTVRLTENHRLIFPGELVAFSRNPSALTSLYISSNPMSISLNKELPDFNIEEGGVVLTDENGAVIDWFPYDIGLHFPSLPSTDGVSLERISFQGFSQDRSRWHSAAGDAGFATPGAMNSQFVDLSMGMDEIRLEPVVFTPDNDGREDVMVLKYDFTDPGRISTVLVFTEEGRYVRSLLVGQSIGTTGYVIWDGTDISGMLMPQGRYVLLMSTLSEGGEEENYSLGCGIVY
ncbi:MAG: lamin tail domain-containing protein [Bacteroidota bacterium]